MELSAMGEMEGVGFDGDDVVGGEFFRAAGEHLVGEVDGEDGGRFEVRKGLVVLSPRVLCRIGRRGSRRSFDCDAHGGTCEHLRSG